GARLTSNPIAFVPSRIRSFLAPAPRDGRPAELSVEPDVFHPPPVVDAIDHWGVPLHIGLPTSPGTVVPEDRSGRVFRQLPFDRPDQFLALILVEFHRLPVDHLVDLRIAVAVIVSFGPASALLVHRLIGVVDAVTREIEAYGVVAAHYLGEPLDGIDRIELAVDVNLLQLVDQQDRSITVGRQVARRHLDPQPLVGPVTELP